MKAREILDDFEQSPKSAGMALRLQLADILLAEIRRRDWSQALLAVEADKHDAQISRILHADANWEADTAGDLLYALGLEPRLTAVPRVGGARSPRTTVSGFVPTIALTGTDLYGHQEDWITNLQSSQSDAKVQTRLVRAKRHGPDISSYVVGRNESTVPA